MLAVFLFSIRSFSLPRYAGKFFFSDLCAKTTRAAMDALQSPSLSFGSKLGMVLAARFSQPNQRESLKLWYFPGSIPQPPGSPVALEMPALRSKCTCFQASNGWVNAMGLSSFSRTSKCYLSVSIPEPRATISIAMMPERLWRPDLAFTLGKRQKALSELTVTKDCAHNAWWLPLGFSTLTLCLTRMENSITRTSRDSF